jgi:hypothetical protein
LPEDPWLLSGNFPKQKSQFNWCEEPRDFPGRLILTLASSAQTTLSIQHNQDKPLPGSSNGFI